MSFFLSQLLISILLHHPYFVFSFREKLTFLFNTVESLHYLPGLLWLNPYKKLDFYSKLIYILGLSFISLLFTSFLAWDLSPIILSLAHSLTLLGLFLGSYRLLLRIHARARFLYPKLQSILFELYHEESRLGLAENEDL
jgi:hypothetical protein